jgi:hypothetical protein
MVERHSGEHSPMMSGDKGTCAIKIGRYKTYKVRTKFDQEGEKRRRKGGENDNGSNRFKTGMQKY